LPPGNGLAFFEYWNNWPIRLDDGADACSETLKVGFRVPDVFPDNQIAVFLVRCFVVVFA
jgi:hypothetical protein